MEDKVPGILEFETPRVHDTSNKTENILKLEDPPIAEDIQPVTDETYNQNDEHEIITADGSNDELLDLNEPPNEEEIKEIQGSSNNTIITDDVISQFAQNLVDPIVKEAIEIQKAEMEDSLSDEVKIDSSGDKKSEKSCSDDGFEYVKADEINSSGNLDQHNDDMRQMLDSESYNKDTEDDSFLTEDLKIEDNDDVYEHPSLIKDHGDDLFLNDDLNLDDSSPDIVYASQNMPDQSMSFAPVHSSGDRGHDDEEEEEEEETPSFIDNFVHEAHPVDEHVDHDKQDDDAKEDDYVFDIQGIINASNLNPIQSLPVAPEPEPSRVESPRRSNISQKFKDIFCWKNPIVSAIILSAVMLIEFGLMCDYSIISLLAYAGLLLLASSFVYKFAIKFNLLKKCDQSECTISVSSDDIQICVDCALKSIEHLFNEIRSLTYVTSFTKNLKAFTFFWILTYIGQWFNLLSLIFIGTIISFSLPIFYTTYKDTIDQVTNDVRVRMKESIDKLKSKSQKLISFRAH